MSEARIQDDLKGEDYVVPRRWPRLRTTTLLLGVLAVILSFAALQQMESVMKPLLFAWILSVVLGPCVRAMTSRKVPTPLAITLSIVLTLFLLFAAGVFLNGRINSFVASYPDYADKFVALFGHFTSGMPDWAGEIFQKFDWINRLGRYVVSLPRAVIGFFSSITIVMIIATFMLFEQHELGPKLRRAFSESRANRIDEVLHDISGQVSRYMILQIIISAATGVCVWLALSVLKVDFAGSWGMLAFVLNFIPTIGSIIASTPPILIALVQYAPDSYWPAILTSLALLAIQMTIGNVISPRVMGDNLNLSPVVVLVSLLFWAWLWGPAGALLSVPVTAAIKIICDNVEPLEPIGVILGSGRAIRKQEKATQADDEPPADKLPR